MDRRAQLIADSLASTPDFTQEFTPNESEREPKLVGLGVESGRAHNPKVHWFKSSPRTSTVSSLMVRPLPQACEPFSR
jgi:hypothetical protein